MAKEFNCSPEQLCLIFAGKIMKDNETLKHHNVKNGLTVHLVIKALPRPDQDPTEPAAPRPPTNVNATPFGLNQLGGLAGMEALGVGQGTFMDLQARMQNEIMNNPNLMRSVLDNPMVQQMMNNPDLMRNLITSNPQMQELMQRNPEISHILNNPDLMRQTLELTRNPSMMQELMRNHDRAMSNLESVPGGYSALQRLYRDIQEPLMNATSEQFGRNPFSGLVDNNPTGANPQQGTENREPLPNPWGGGGGNTGSTATTGAAPAGILNSAPMQSLLAQMSENPQLMSNLMNAPYTRDMLAALQADPNMASELLSQNPLLANNPQLREQMRAMMPNMLERMQSPEVQQMMSNPQALNAIMQIQQGMEQLRQVAPDLVGSMGIPPPVIPLNTTTPASTTTTTSASGEGVIPPSPTPANNPALFQDFMARMLGGMANQQNPNLPPEERYQSQLEQLTQMGFLNREANLQGECEGMENLFDGREFTIFYFQL